MQSDLFHNILYEFWGGYSSFRPLQEEIIQSVWEGRDTLGLMPTGGGKSLTFQVPVMAMKGICLVVTPSHIAHERSGGQPSRKRY